VSATVPNAALLAPGVGAPAPLSPAPATPATGSGPVRSDGPSFASVLDEQTAATQPPHFSRHALDRLSQRGISLDRQTVGRLSSGIDRAATKGSRDSVVFVDNTAFVVSVANNTVITAVDSAHMREQVFTNIDSAVIA
jgi:flagellar operon protein